MPCLIQFSFYALKIKTYYGVRRNLLVKFQNDSIDETPRLAQTLAQKSAVSSFLDLSVRTLPGDHATPCLQVNTFQLTLFLTTNTLRCTIFVDFQVA